MLVSFSDINLLKQLSCKIYCCLASIYALEVDSKYLNEVLYYYYKNYYYSEGGTENEREGRGGGSESVKPTVAWVIISYFMLNHSRKCLVNP